MSKTKYVAYFRVSTARQGVSGLGLDSQRETVSNFVAGRGEVIGEYTEVETGKGGDALAKRPQLAAALALCKKSGATLAIAKLDRLSRSLLFIATLMQTKTKFVACDLPEANTLTLHLMAAFAEHEAKRISERTKDALAQAKLRGVVLGATAKTNFKPNHEARTQAADAFAERLRHVIDGMARRGLTERRMVLELNDLGIRTARGGEFSETQLRRVRARLANMPALAKAA
jgi:DNA invertase Pin-like site-specific DNA recombinase